MIKEKIGNDDPVVKNNYPKVYFGGELVRALLAEGNGIRLNNHENTSGGPFTWVDPSDPGKLSCLDLVIISKNLLPYFKSMIIDSERKYSPVRPISKSESRHSDQVPVIVTFENIPVRNLVKVNRNAHIIWKEGKRKTFKTSTEYYQQFEDKIGMKQSNTENVSNLEKLLKKKKLHILQQTHIPHI